MIGVLVRLLLTIACFSPRNERTLSRELSSRAHVSHENSRNNAQVSPRNEPNSTAMPCSSPPLTLLPTLFILLVSLPLTSPKIPPTSSPNNDYNQTKSLCFNCLAESLQFLYHHNLVRLAHWQLPLVWDPRLESYARWWAEQRRADCALRHSFPEGGFVLGENIFWGPGPGWGPADAVRAWAEEERWYDYERNECEPGRMCGHYTQVVWHSTRRVGCARVVCDDGDVFMTCNYDPPGNYVGERPY